MTACSSGPGVKTGNLVKLEYTGLLKDGTQFETNVGKTPLTILVGANQALPAFEKAITGMKSGASKKFTIKAKEAYGTPDPKKVTKIAKSSPLLPKDLKVKVGDFITANTKAANGQIVPVPVKVVEVSDKEITLDYNHPLAGQDLTFKVKVLEIVDTETLKKQAVEAKVVEVEDQAKAKK